MKKSTHFLAIALIMVAIAAFPVYFHDSPVLVLIGTIELVLIGIVVNTFVVLYARRNWRANPYGRALMYSKISLAVLVDLSLAIAFLGTDWEWRPALRVILFGGILFAQARLLQLLFSLRNIAARAQYDIDHKEVR